MGQARNEEKIEYVNGTFKIACTRRLLCKVVFCLIIIIGLAALITLLVGLFLGRGWKKKPEMQQAAPVAVPVQPSTPGSSNPHGTTGSLHMTSTAKCTISICLFETIKY